MAYGLSPGRVKQLAYEIAKSNGIQVPKNWELNKQAGKKWFRGFLKRHPDLSVRKPEACSLSRLTSFNNLKNIFDKYPELNNPARIFNLDETGIVCKKLLNIELINFYFTLLFSIIATTTVQST